MDKKVTKKKVTKIETIKLGFEPCTTVVINSVTFKKQANGNYLNKTTNKEVKLVK